MGAISIPNLTLRGLPEKLLGTMREMAVRDRRSLNSEVLVLLERAVHEFGGDRMSPEAIEGQVRSWRSLEWHDPRSAREISKDIISRRSVGRDVTL